MDDKEFYLDKIKNKAPQIYEFSKKHWDKIKITAAGRNLDRSEFCLRFSEQVLLTKEVLSELILIEEFQYIYSTRWDVNIQFKIKNAEQ
jgi:hypothetical protein